MFFAFAPKLMTAALDVGTVSQRIPVAMALIVGANLIKSEGSFLKNAASHNRFVLLRSSLFSILLELLPDLGRWATSGPFFVMRRSSPREIKKRTQRVHPFSSSPTWAMLWLDPKSLTRSG